MTVFLTVFATVGLGICGLGSLGLAIIMLNGLRPSRKARLKHESSLELAFVDLKLSHSPNNPKLLEQKAAILKELQRSPRETLLIAGFSLCLTAGSLAGIIWVVWNAVWNVEI
ncbi:MAG: hypothetical protein JWM56_1270 [Candidatus Peribacteria bacterium]|nr:hypothetical protein [Candidatus Peribacteria bacterium]